MEENKRSNKSFLLVIVGLLLIVAGIIVVFYISGKDSNSGNSEVKKVKINPLMYKVTKEGSDNVVYLFGSIHVANFDEIEFPEYLTKAYDESSYIAVEYDLTKSLESEAAMELQSRMMYDDETTLKDHLSEAVYNKLVDFLDEKKYGSIKAFDNYKTLMVYQLLSQKIYTDLGLKAQDSIDLYFINKANEDQKSIIEVESEDYQIGLLLSFSDKLNEVMIENLIDNYDKAVEETKNLYDAWKKGDPALIDEIANKGITEEDKKKYDEKMLLQIESYQKKLVSDRNIGMANKLESLFDEDFNTLFIVGAAHLVGDDGIASLLEARGYTVVQINK